MTTVPATVSGSAAALRRLRVPAPEGFVEAVLDRLGLATGEWFVTVTGPTGELFVAFNQHGISAVAPTSLYDGDTGRFAAEHQERTGAPPVPAERPPAGLAAALESGRAGKLRFDLAASSEFERAVLLKALEIPPGEVRPYGWVAREIGRPRAVRAVGSALGRNPVPILIPCHRVVRTDGHVGNYGLGVPLKLALLGAEGVDVDRLERLADEGVRFVGSATTHVFCVPSCRHARRISPAHERRFRTEDAAVAGGFRPCAHCRPTEVRRAS
ncbi:MAG TPA: methylated-DNA--[protein]-cysteine S-methyltransferase [Acidimicrobiales bacterium]|nr:methylated-DNA--[protein]-cysteine S-methyltransferase [Acidimicrobiales bacterium]